MAFDLSPSSDPEEREDVAKGEMQCNLYGHANVIPASSLKGNCYRLAGAEVIPDEEDHVKPKIDVIDDGSLDKLRSKGGETCFCLRFSLVSRVFSRIYR